MWAAFEFIPVAGKRQKHYAIDNTIVSTFIMILIIIMVIVNNIEMIKNTRLNAILLRNLTVSKYPITPGTLWTEITLKWMHVKLSNQRLIPYALVMVATEYHIT